MTGELTLNFNRRQEHKAKRFLPYKEKKWKKKLTNCYPN
jgi:hypothetical protein